MTAAVPPASNNISEVVEKLRRLSQVEVQSGWRYCDSDSAVSAVNICNWPVAELNEKGHIAWPCGKQVLHLGQHLVIPNTLHGYPLTGLRLLLGLTWWAQDARIFVNGELVGQGDLFDCADRVLLSPSATGGDEFLVILRLVSPGHDAGALVRSICLYEAADSACFDPSFVAAELEILHNSLAGNSQILNPQYLPNEIVAHRPMFVKGERLKSAIDLAVGLIDWSALPDRAKFDRSLSILRQTVLGYLRNFSGDFNEGTAEDAEGAEEGEKREVFGIGESGSTSIYIGKICLLGHAHLDLAWLWPIGETWEAAERTFESVLKLQSEFPDLIFCHSTPALYAWIEEHRPQLFAAIKKQVIAGRWEVVGGMWVEPDLNLISGESMVRQVVYGQLYAQEKFGELMRVAWLPDTFGFGWQLPQILQQGGVDYFVTQKLRWNDTTEFPYGAFLWEGLDGTRIFSMMSAAIGEGIDAVKMANYVFDWQVKTNLHASLWLPGVGDHGGGPTRDMLEVAKRWEMSPFFPKLEFAKAVDYLSAIESRFLEEVSESAPQVDVPIRPNQQNLKVAENAENLRAIELLNSPAVSESSPKSSVAASENKEDLKLAETGGNLQSIEFPNSPAIAENSPPSGVAKSDKLEVGLTAGNLQSIELPNKSAMEAISPQSNVAVSENKEDLKLPENAENLRAIEFPHSPAIAENSPKSSVAKSDKLEVSLTAGNLQSIELLNSPAVSETSPKSSVAASENKEDLKLAETGGNLQSIASGNLSASKLKTIPSPLPIWKDELYLEFHRGCYTTRADQKRQNRRCEELLYQAELLSAIATICTGAVYPKSELETAWKQVLFNQFHDILPGSAIAPVYADANLAFERADRTCRDLMLKSLDAISQLISLPSPPQPDAVPVLIFNTLNWDRSEVVAVPIRDSAWEIYDLSRQRLISQIVRGDRLQPQFTLLFCADRIPALGYRIFWLCRKESETAETSLASGATSKNTDLSKLTYGIAQNFAPCQETHFAAETKVLENEIFRATVDGETGSLSGIWDKTNNREVLNEVGGNQLQAFQDSGQYWDAWNIDPNYQKHQLPPPILKDMCWVEQGEVRQSLRVIRQIGKSEFCQDYTVETGSPLLKIKTVANWQEKHVLVKTAFGLNQEAEFATCEIPCGAIERTTKPQTDAEKAKWEVPILRWTDISNDGFGVSLLNDCKYGCDIQPNQLRLTLLRGSAWPDEEADLGIHEFTCAVYPHAGNWQDAGTVRRGYELNVPLLVKVLPQLQENCRKTLPAVGKFLDLSAENLVLMAFKQSEDDSNLWILRCYEAEGKQAALELDGDLGLEIVRAVDLLERPVNLCDNLPKEQSFKIEPWKIASFAVVTNREGAKDAKEEKIGSSNNQ